MQSPQLKDGVFRVDQAQFQNEGRSASTDWPSLSICKTRRANSVLADIALFHDCTLSSRVLAVIADQALGVPLLTLFGPCPQEAKTELYSCSVSVPRMIARPLARSGVGGHFGFVEIEEPSLLLAGPVGHRV